MTTKPILLCLLAVLSIQGAARACQYCALAANDPEMARLAAEMHAKSGGFPLDASLNKFQPGAQSAVLNAPPPAASVATRAADLASVVPRRALPPPVARPAAAKPAPQPAQKSTDHWADGGLLGLLGLAGFFGWRTRRATVTAAGPATL